MDTCKFVECLGSLQEVRGDATNIIPRREIASNTWIYWREGGGSNTSKQNLQTWLRWS